jgi:hypothetical protein
LFASKYAVAVRAQALDHRRHVRAGVGAALERGEISAHALLEVPHLAAERREVARFEGRQCAVDDAFPQVRLLGAGEGGKRFERGHLVRAVEPLGLRIEDEKHAPVLGEGDARLQRRQGTVSRAAVEHGPARLVGRDADTRPRAAAEPCGDLDWCEVEPFECGEGGAHGERELGA